MSHTVATVPPPRSFLGLPTLDRIGPGTDLDVAVLGLPHGMRYAGEPDPNDQARAPGAIRTESSRLTLGADHHDFDLGGPLLDGQAVRMADVGDLPRRPGEPPGPHHARIEAAARILLGHGTLLVGLGGDHGAPIPVFRALDAVGAAVTLVQVDAHLDWRDEVGGEREGYSSPIRRASELDHVGTIVQVGLRAQGSARPGEVEAARAYGAHLVTAYDVHAGGVDVALAHVPAGGPVYLTIDADGLDPSVMPAVAGPAPGGLLYHHVRALVHGLVARGRLVGLDLVEITPARDVNGISALTAGQIVLNAIGASVRSGRLPVRSRAGA